MSSQVEDEMAVDKYFGHIQNWIFFLLKDTFLGISTLLENLHCCATLYLNFTTFWKPDLTFFSSIYL